MEAEETYYVQPLEKEDSKNENSENLKENSQPNGVIRVLLFVMSKNESQMIPIIMPIT